MAIKSREELEYLENKLKLMNLERERAIALGYEPPKEVSQPLPQTKSVFESPLAATAAETVGVPVSLESAKRIFTPIPGSAGTSRILQKEGEKVGEAVRGSVKKLQESVDVPPQTPLGRYFLPYAKTITKSPELVSETLTPKGAAEFIGGEALPIVSGMAAARAGANWFLSQKGLPRIASRRHAGFQKSLLVSQKSPTETLRKIAKANQAAETILEEGTISKSGNIETTLDNTVKLKHETNKAISAITDEIDSAGPSISIPETDSKLLTEINPKFDDQFAVTESILNDLSKYGKDRITLKQARELKTRWGNFGYEQRTVGTEASKIYRKASDYMEKVISQKVKEIGGDEIHKQYVAARTTNAASRTALKGITNEAAGQEGRSLVSLPAAVGGAATGNVPKAVAYMGTWELLKRRGAGIAARGLFGLGKAATKAAEKISKNVLKIGTVTGAGQTVGNIER